MSAFLPAAGGGRGLVGERRRTAVAVAAGARAARHAGRAAAAAVGPRARARRPPVLRMFAPYRGRLGVVLGLIVISSVLSMLSPFLLRACSTRASSTTG